MINLHYSNGKVFVWNEKDVFTLRKEHRIVGSLVGCCPVKSFQGQTKWLPLQLITEEVKLLIDKGLGQLVSMPEKCDDSQFKSFSAHQDKLWEEQILLLRENRKKEILERADVIYEGKKRKLLEASEKKKKIPKTCNTSNSSQEGKQSHSTEVEENNSNSVEECPETIQIDTSVKDKTESDAACDLKPHGDEDLVIDKDAVIEAELAKIPELDTQLCMVQLFTENPWKSVTPVQNWKCITTHAKEVRYAVFKDLWEKGYYITSGSKFGGDFLAYEGDPLKYHALFIIVCLSSYKKIQGFDLVVYGRLGHQVKKTVALASLNEDGRIEYISLRWENEML